MILQLTNVGKTYRGRTGDVHALEDVSLKVEEGDFVAVQGPSGCGKSTLLLLAGGLLAPSQGTVEVAGQNPYALSAEARSRFRAEQIGFVFQQFHLVPYLSVLDNVLTPSLALNIPAAKKKAIDLLERFGMSHRLNHTPGELSTGERQRTSLARALLASPKLLLADEPTGNLDPANAQAVLGFLTEFTSQGGGVLLVTHEIDAAARASRSIHLDAGRVREIIHAQGEQ